MVIDPKTGKVVGTWPTDYDIGDSGEGSLDAAGNLYVFTYVPEELVVFDPKGHLRGLRAAGARSTGYQWDSLLWPPPVFDAGGSGYTFGPDGLVRLRVSLASP